MNTGSRGRSKAHGLNASEFGFDEVGVEFVESFALRAGAGEIRDLADTGAAVGASLDDGREAAQG